MDYIIIVAGGKGLRMGSDIPKQFLPIGGKPVLMRTLERFREYSKDIQIILVLPEATAGVLASALPRISFRRGIHTGQRWTDTFPLCAERIGQGAR